MMHAAIQDGRERTVTVVKAFRLGRVTTDVPDDLARDFKRGRGFVPLRHGCTDMLTHNVGCDRPGPMRGQLGCARGPVSMDACMLECAQNLACGAIAFLRLKGRFEPGGVTVRR